MIAILLSVWPMKIASPLLAVALVALPITGRVSSESVINAQPLPEVDEPVVPAGLLRPVPDVEEAARTSAIAAGIEAVKRAGILKKALTVGNKAVDFELNDAAGYRIKASELWAVGPLVVVCYRGGWSPDCNAHLVEMQKALREIQRAGAQLVAISPESVEQALATQARNKLTFPLLPDKGNAVARQFGIVYRAATEEMPKAAAAAERTDSATESGDELPLAATYVIDSGGVIRYAFLSGDFSRRAKTQAVIKALGRLRGNAPAEEAEANDRDGAEPEPIPEQEVPVDRSARVQR